MGDLSPPTAATPTQVLAEFEAAGIGVDALAARLQEEGKKSFVNSWNELLKTIESQLAEPQPS